MQWESLLSQRRFGSPSISSRVGAEWRSEFERDYDRLIFSPAFRRLQNKTQVFPLPGNIFVHNRLTHSLEVSCVGRSLGSMVGSVLSQRHPYLGRDLFVPSLSAIVSAACLAHDMGNTPFGHGGEDAIGAYFREGNGAQWREAVQAEGGRWSDFVCFEGNANALRLLTHQFDGRREGGFALTYATLGSIIKYPFSSELSGGKNKFGFFATEEDTMRDIATELGLEQVSNAPLSYKRHPLVYLVEAADDICYQVMDIEDAYRLSILSYSEAVSELLLPLIPSADQARVSARLSLIADPHEQVGYLRSVVIGALVETVAQIFLDNEEAIMNGSYSGSLIHQLPDQMYRAFEHCSAVARQRIYRSKPVADVELAAHQIFTALLDKLLHALHHPDHAYSKALLSRLSAQYGQRHASTYSRIQTALDYISGMTDLYALDLYRRITGLNLPAI